MIKIKSPILLTGLFLTLPSLALDPMPSETGSITKLQIHNAPGNGSERYMVNLDSIITVNEGGELCGIDQWTGYLETKGDQAQFSAILAAKLAKKPVWIQGTSGDCLGTEQIIRNVYIQD